MKNIAAVLFGAFLLLSSGCGKTDKQEVVLPLTEKEIAKAVDYGIKNASLSVTEFTSGWTVDMGYKQGKGTATIITPFLRVALLSRQAALSGEEIPDLLIKTAIKEDLEFINFEVILFGGSPTFARDTLFLLKYDTKQVQPSYCFMPPYSEIARDYTQIAKGRVKFQRTGIPADAKIVLVASFKTEEEAEDVSVCEFAFDLSKYL